MILNNLSPQILIINLVVLGVGMTVHEFSHNYVGWKMGDPEPKRQGRITLNPLVHINWIGWIMFAVIGFGVLGSAPIARNRMRNPRLGYFAATAAGPVSNLLVAAVFGLILQLFTGAIAASSGFVQTLVIRMITLNVLLFVFNILPLYPLDGWHIVYALLPEHGSPGDPAGVWLRSQKITSYIFFGLIIWSVLRSYLSVPIPDPLSILISRPVGAISRFLVGG